MTPDAGAMRLTLWTIVLVLVTLIVLAAALLFLRIEVPQWIISAVMLMIGGLLTHLQKVDGGGNREGAASIVDDPPLSPETHHE